MRLTASNRPGQAQPVPTRDIPKQPWGRLALLCAAVVAAGTVTAAIAARRAASRDAVLAVKEDW